MGKGSYIMKRLHTEEEHRIILPACYHYNDEESKGQKNDKPKLKQLLNNLISILGVGVTFGATIATIGVGVISFSQYRAETPNLVIKTQVLYMPSSSSKLPPIISMLDEIEREYEDITDYIILDLREKVKFLLEKELEIEISDFGEDPNQRTVLLGYLSSGNNLNVLENTDTEKIKEMIGESISEINKKMKNGLTSESDKDRLRKILEVLEQQKKYPKVNLQRKDFDKQKIVVKLLIENYSKSRNWVYKTGAIRFYKNREDERLIIGNFKQDSNSDTTQNQSEYILIDGNGLKLLKFESKILEKLEKDKHFLESAFKNECNYMVAVEDVKGEVWFAEGTVVPYYRDYHTENLKNETRKMLEKKYN